MLIELKIKIRMDERGKNPHRTGRLEIQTKTLIHDIGSDEPDDCRA